MLCHRLLAVVVHYHQDPKSVLKLGKNKERLRISLQLYLKELFS